ncbi:hypothetical protein BCY86_03545 [Pajaroellobacter abortibovis]|uniref:Uncharacterized protein n=1 Tax=Pajaroellobacter abortibovis TaxID=1882918 RepID=A0A1L6MWD9_9BACT|nr:hypothetical protein BCY86_03545 [Pajaroellobacter abortibovis]
MEVFALQALCVWMLSNLFKKKSVQFLLSLCRVEFEEICKNRPAPYNCILQTGVGGAKTHCNYLAQKRKLEEVRKLSFSLWLGTDTELPMARFDKVKHYPVYNTAKNSLNS